MDMVDERVRAVEKSVMRDFWVRAPLSAKVFLLATLCIVLYIFKSKLHDVQATRRERLNQRRRAGIPDSDTRPFRLAFQDAEARRRAKVAEQAADHKKRQETEASGLSTSLSSSSMQQLSIPRSSSRKSLASPRPQSQFLSPAIPSNSVKSSRRSAASPSPFGSLRPQPSFSSLRNDITNSVQREDRRPLKRQLDDPDDQEAGEDKKARIESDPHLRHHQQSRGQRRKRSETPEDPESVEGDGKTVKKSRQEEDSISEAEGMDMDDTFADYSSKKYQQSDDMDLEVGDQIDDDSSVRIMQSRVDGLSERPKRPRSVSVETTLSSTQDRPARKTTRRVSRQPSLSTLKSSPSMSLSPDLRAKLAKKSHKPRPGETWKDPSGAKLRINAQGVKEQLVKVKERRPKYNMPKGSKHPSANIMEERIVEKWLDEMAYEKAKSQGMLEWQTEEDAKYEQQKLQRLVTARSSSPSQDERSERSIFFQRGAASPSFQKATSPKSKGLQRDNSSVTNIEFLPNGRVKLPRSRSQHLTPRRSLASLEQDLSASARRKSAVKKSESARALNQPAQESSTSQLALAASTPVDQPSKDKSPSGSPFSFTPASSHQGSVGPSAAPTPPQQTSAAAPSTSAPAFSFSKPPVDSATEPASSSQPTFSFPTSSSSLGTSATKPTTETSFSFDSTAASSTSKPSESSKPAFSFGASPSPSPQLPSASQAGAASSFSFGSSATLTAPQPAEQPKSTFSFAPGASTSASPSPGPSTPTLGVISPSLNQSTLSKPANEGPSAFNFGGTSKPQTSASGFSFGSSASASTASKPADEPKPTFSFGSAGTTSNSLGASTSQSGAASSGFSFGSAPSTSSAPSQSSAPSTSFAFGQSQQQASSGFTFGAGSNAPSQPGTPSTFKFELGPGGGSPSLASGGSSQPRGFRAGRSNPSRRRI